MESWSARTNQQVRDRIDRIGQTKETSTIVLVSEGTVEESRRRSVADKVDRQQLVLRDKAELSSFLNGTM
jgi:SNF2 family DNA or RNA helicase